jgi:hypothetical protein
MSGNASFITSTLTAGSHTLTAVYGGDANYQTFTSTAITELVQDFSLSTPSGDPTTVTIKLNQVATYSLLLTPLDGSTFPANIALTVSGAPIDSIVTFTPFSISVGSGPTPFTVSVAIGYLTGSKTQNPLFRIAPLSWALLLLPLIRGVRRKLSAVTRAAILLFAGLGLMAGISGCGYHENINKTFTMTVTASSGSLSHSTTLTMKVD